jgi:NADH:ubiquinone oxidoreductase subunit 6 (subunit J)
MNRAGATGASKPLRRLKYGALCLVIAFMLLALSGALPGAEAPLRTGAAVAAVVALGCLIASVLATAGNGITRIAERNPSQTQRVAFVVGVLVLLLLGGYAVALSIVGVLSGHAPLISRHVGSVAQAANPLYFWLSVVFHLALGVLLISGAIYSIALRKRREP